MSILGQGRQFNRSPTSSQAQQVGRHRWGRRRKRWERWDQVGRNGSSWAGSFAALSPVPPVVEPYLCGVVGRHRRGRRRKRWERGTKVGRNGFSWAGSFATLSPVPPAVEPYLLRRGRAAPLGPQAKEMRTWGPSGDGTALLGRDRSPRFRWFPRWWNPTFVVW